MYSKYYINDKCLVEGEGGNCPVEIYIAPDESERRYCIKELGIDEHNLIPALVISLFSMNVLLPVPHHWSVFFIIAVLAAITAAVTVKVLIKQK